MLSLTVPWWDLVLRGVVVYVLLLIMVRASGKRTLGQFTPFDLLVLLLLSEAVSNSLNAGDESLIGGLIVAGVLILLNLGASILTARSQRARSFWREVLRSSARTAGSMKRHCAARTWHSPTSRSACGRRTTNYRMSRRYFSRQMGASVSCAARVVPRAWVTSPIPDILTADRSGGCCSSEWQARVDLAACYRLVEIYGMADMMARRGGPSLRGHGMACTAAQARTG